jgi:hypothetical protein
MLLRSALASPGDRSLNFGQNPELTNVAVYPFALGEWDQEGAVAEGPPNPGYSLVGE